MTNETAYDELTADSVTGYAVTATESRGNETVSFTGGAGVVYPFGTDSHVVTTAPFGVETVTREWHAANARITEAVSAGVTNRTLRVQGGAAIEEKHWDGKWTRETRLTAYDASGRRVETVTAEASDCPVFAKSVTTYDFLGRAVSVSTPNSSLLTTP